MRRIKDVEHAKLEHIYPQSRSLQEGHPEQTVDYNNMLVTCLGGDGDPHRSRSSQTCDTHKADSIIAINPSIQSDIDTIKYYSDGSIGSDNPEFERDLCETLNLNCQDSFLPQDRKRVYESMQKLIQKADPKTHEAKRAFAKKMLKRISESPIKVEFAGVVIYRLKRWAR